MKPISNNTSNYLSKAITTMTKADSLAPIIALEATVVGGRTYQAYQRGKWDEARERFIEETMGSIVWLCGVKSLNKLGDKAVERILKAPGKNFDVGTDKVLRTPFDNFMKKVAPKGFSPKQVALLKAFKVLTSIVIANLFIGFAVPKANQALTEKLRSDKEKKAQEKQGSQPTFKGMGGAIGAINKFTNCIENTNTGQLLSSDVGVAGGRMYNARSKEERREIAIRDIGSIYFYMWAQGHVIQLLNLAESGNSRRLNPETAKTLDNHLTNFIGNKEMTVEEFRKAVLGSSVELPKGLVFESGELSSWDKLMKNKPLEVIKLSELEKVVTDPEVLSRAREMAKLQPQRLGESVLTKQQVVDALNKAEINDPKFLYKVFDDFTKGDFRDEYKYVSNSKLYNLKAEMEQYVNMVCKEAKGGKVDKALLAKANKKNLIYNGINFAAAFTVAAAFLSTFIPKIQYYVTRKTTGVDAFPGTYEFEKQANSHSPQSKHSCP